MRTIKTGDFFVLRRPTYSISKLDKFYNSLTSSELEEALRQFYQEPLAQEAMLAASPSLYTQFRRWLNGEMVPKQKQLLNTLQKYLVRMCSRSTPYGLFAGCSSGTFAEYSHLRASPALRAYTRVDIDCLQAIGIWLTGQPLIRSQLRLYPNSSLYPVGASLRYVEQQRDTGERHYFISAVEPDAYLNQLLEAARHGVTIAGLADQFPDVPAEEIEEFVDQLIDNQILCFDIEPTVTGPNYLDRLTDRIAGLADTAAVTQSLRDLAEHLQQPNRLTAYTRVQHWFTERSIPQSTANVVQVNAYFDVPDLTIGATAIRHLQQDLEKLLVLNQPAKSLDLDAFRQRFVNRYEEEEVALSLALDSDFGLGYGNSSMQGVGYAPLIDDLHFGTSTQPVATSWDWLQQLVMDKYVYALRTQQTEIVLTDDDLTYIGRQGVQDTPLPTSFYAFGSILARSEKAIDEGDFQFNLLACTGSSAMNLLSRFGEGDAELASRIQAWVAIEEEQHPDVVIAEIVHLPENRAGNILARPRIHRYEIPYLGQASVDEDHQIPLTDLMVSVRNNQLVLRSKRLNRRVIPRLTTAHNFSQGLPVYRFLCDLQAQDAYLQTAWKWGVLHDQTYLPRVRYNRVIMSRATWQLQCNQLTPDNPLKLVAELTAAGLPQQFVVAQADNELLISMHVPASLDLLIQEMRRHDRIRLIEFLQQPDRCPLTHKREVYTHELIIPFFTTEPPVLAAFSKRKLPAQVPQRRFSIGSEWLYLKLYTGEKASDQLLTQHIYPVVQELLRTQAIEAFYFVRYQDTDAHLRLRFRGNPDVDFYRNVVRLLRAALQEDVASGVVHKVQVDTYQRELERYGMEQIEQCEMLFHYDSLSTLDFMAKTGSLFDEQLRFLVAVAKIDRLLKGMGLSTQAQRQVLTNLKETFFNEFGGETALRQQLNDKYRLYQPLINQALLAPFTPVEGIWQWDTQQARLLLHLAEAVSEQTQLFNLAGSLIHMTINRLFPSKQRIYELVLYHCMAKHYGSVLGRQAAALPA